MFYGVKIKDKKLNRLHHHQGTILRHLKNCKGLYGGAGEKNGRPEIKETVHVF
jgi:hypothetical protein